MPPNAIAIVGMAGRFPDARGLDDFWKNIVEGHESLRTFPPETLVASGVPEALVRDPAYVPKGTVLDDADLFDAGFFGLSPGEAQTMDPQHRLFLECAWEALEHAGYPPDGVSVPVGVFAGASMNSYMFAHVLSNRKLAEAAGAYQLMIGNDKDFLCTRVSYKLDLHGPSVTVQTACSTSLVAVEVACRALERGECDMALAGGVALNFPQGAGYLYQEGMIFSPDGHCRPFDAAAKGTRAGAGAGVVTLKRLADALRDGDTVHAVIRGIAVNNDGAAKAGYTAPSIDGQAEVIATAQTLASVEPRSIGYVEAHGTATPLGDPIEIAALTQVFRSGTPDVGFCRLGSLKANIGHLDAAAGVAGLIKAVLVVREGHIPPLVNFRTANPQLQLESSPFTASGEGAPWTGDGRPRRAAVSSFGIGGTNAHAVLEQAPEADPAPPARRTEQLLVLSARSEPALAAASANLARRLEGEGPALADVAWTLQAGRSAFPYRRFVVATDRAGAAAELVRPVPARRHEGGTRRVAFLFSGQGSQHAGMGRRLYEQEPVYRAAVDAAAEILAPHLGRDLREAILGADDATLAETRITQPALFVTEYALARLWQSLGIEPAAMLGHSIGEYVAAHLAGVMTLEDALAVVAERGRPMQSMAPGTMLAVELAVEALRPRLPEAVEIAAVNAPELTAVAGPTHTVEAFAAALEAEGIGCRRLHTSHAFHSAMMEPALDRFRAAVSRVTLAAPQIPYVSNVTGRWITAEEATSADYYARHLRQAVLFEPGLRMLAEDPGLFLLEVGPGTTLASLAGMTLAAERSRIAASLPHPREGEACQRAMLAALGSMWAAGVPVDWRAFHGDDRTPRRVPLPTYPFERSRHWVDPRPEASAAQTAPPATHAAKPADIGLFLHAPTWMPIPFDPNRRIALSGAWLVIADDAAIGAEIAAGLSNAGAEPVLRLAGGAAGVGVPPFRPDAADDISAAIGGAPAPLAGVIVALGLGATSVPAGVRYDVPTALARALEDATNQSGVSILHVTCGAARVLDELVLDADAALAAGPLAAIPVELPGLATRRVDLEAGEDAADGRAAARIVVAEAATVDGEAAVAWRGGRRWVRRFEPVALPPAEPTGTGLRKRGVYLVTGGLGGLGLIFALWLARTASARIVLTARRVPPPRDEWEAYLAGAPPDDRMADIVRRLQEIEAAGGEVAVERADAVDLQAMRAAIDRTRIRWGELSGVIHAAGTPGVDQAASATTAEGVAETLDPKVQGTRVLAELLKDVPLDFVVLMSSINSVLTWPGSSAYTSASFFLDAFAVSAKRPEAWKRVVVFNWDAWRDVGMAVHRYVPEAFRAGRQQFLAQGVPSATGLEVFARTLASGFDQVVVSRYDLPNVLAQGRTALREAVAGVSAAAAPATGVAASATVTPPATVDARFAREEERSIAAVWTELIGVEMDGPHENFFERGGHSLMATRVLARLNGIAGVKLTLRDVFDAPTIGALADRWIALREQADTETDDREEFVI
jgi:acyl transferase domain-containing protein